MVRRTRATSSFSRQLLSKSSRRTVKDFLLAKEGLRSGLSGAEEVPWQGVEEVLLREALLPEGHLLEVI